MLRDNAHTRPHWIWIGNPNPVNPVSVLVWRVPKWKRNIMFLCHSFCTLLSCPINPQVLVKHRTSRAVNYCPCKTDWGVSLLMGCQILNHKFIQYLSGSVSLEWPLNSCLQSPSSWFQWCKSARGVAGAQIDGSPWPLYIVSFHGGTSRGAGLLTEGA